MFKEKHNSREKRGEGGRCFRLSFGGEPLPGYLPQILFPLSQERCHLSSVTSKYTQARAEKEAGLGTKAPKASPLDS